MTARVHKRILTGMLAASLIMQTGSVIPAIAAEEDEATIISEEKAVSDGIENDDVHEVVVIESFVTQFENITINTDEMAANSIREYVTAETGNTLQAVTGGGTTDVKITGWEETYEQNGAETVYAFTPVLENGYALTSGASMPILKVTVLNTVESDTKSTESAQTLATELSDAQPELSAEIDDIAVNTTLLSGAEANGEDTFKWALESNSVGHGFCFEITFNGPENKAEPATMLTDEETGQTEVAGGVQIRIPSHILFGQNGEPADIVSISTDDINDGIEGSSFTYIAADDGIVIYNVGETDLSQKQTFTVTYATSLPTSSYIVQGENLYTSKPFTASTVVYPIGASEQNQSTTIYAESDPIYIQILPQDTDTTADVTFHSVSSLDTDLKTNGAEYRLFGTTDSGKEVDMTAVSGATNDGETAFHDVEAGNYTLTELNAPEGYIPDDTAYTVKVDKQGNYIISYKLEDTETQNIAAEE